MTRYLLRRIYLNNGGYDRNGTYWGRGAPLYEFEAAETSSLQDVRDDYGTLRAKDRETAKAVVRKHRPTATFYR